MADLYRHYMPNDNIELKDDIESEHGFGNITSYKA